MNKSHKQMRNEQGLIVCAGLLLLIVFMNIPSMLDGDDEGVDQASKQYEHPIAYTLAEARAVENNAWIKTKGVILQDGDSFIHQVSENLARSARDNYYEVIGNIVEPVSIATHNPPQDRGLFYLSGTNRRMNIFVPLSADEEIPIEEKQNVFFFQELSGVVDAFQTRFETMKEGDVLLFSEVLMRYSHLEHGDPIFTLVHDNLSLEDKGHVNEEFSDRYSYFVEDDDAVTNGVRLFRRLPSSTQFTNGVNYFAIISTATIDHLERFNTPQFQRL